jgi:predicted NACHT family NTPase
MAEGGGISIPVFSWFDDPIKQSVRSVFAGINEKVEALDVLRTYRNAHFKGVQDAVASIKILGMSEPVPLTQVYSPARASTTIHRRLYKQETIQSTLGPVGDAKEKGLVSAAAFIDRHARTVVLGGPGSGKTTLLKHLALAYIDASVFTESELKASRFPFFVPLPVLATSGKGLEDYICDDLAQRTDGFARSFIKRLLDNDMAVVILDSLDEVPTMAREGIIKSIVEFCGRYTQVKYVLSCRTADYQEWLPNFFEIELARLSRTAANKVIRCWFTGEESKAERLIQHLKADKGVASLTETPLLLSLLCIQFGHDLALPQRKTELYRRCVDALLRNWDAGRNFRRDTAYSKLSDDRKERIFEVVAGRFFRQDPVYVFPTSELLEVVGTTAELFDLAKSDAEGIINEIEKHHGIFEKLSVESFCFSHPSFEEYFAARCFIEDRQEFEIVRAHYDNDSWNPVIEFIVALKPDPAELLEFLQTKSTVSGIKTYPAMGRRTRHLWLLYRCLSLAPSITPQQWRLLNEHLFESQIEIMRVYREGGVVPLAGLMSDGIRHAFYSYGSRRQTLMTALQPFRQLANEILLSPSPKYAEVLLERFAEIAKAGLSADDTVALGLSLLLPIASVRPREVKVLLQKLHTDSKLPFVKKFIENSQKVLLDRFMR